MRRDRVKTSAHETSEIRSTVFSPAISHVAIILVGALECIKLSPIPGLNASKENPQLDEKGMQTQNFVHGMMFSKN